MIPRTRQTAFSVKHHFHTVGLLGTKKLGRKFEERTFIGQARIWPSANPSANSSSDSAKAKWAARLRRSEKIWTRSA